MKECGCGVLIGVEQCWQEVGTGTAHGGGNPKKAHQEVGKVVGEDVAIVAVVVAAVVAAVAVVAVVAVVVVVASVAVADCRKIAELDPAGPSQANSWWWLARCQWN